MAKKKLLIFLVLFWLFTTTVVLAQDFSSTNFVNENPVVTLGGGKSTSTNFQLLSGAGQTIIGENSSSAFTTHAGFFYFPSVSTPVILATASDAQVSLSWTTAVGVLGFNINGYALGKSTSSGGPYTFSSVGNVLSTTATSLTNGTTYYFVVRALDFLGDSVVTSTEVSATPVAAVAPSPPSVIGGGGIPVSVPQSVAVLYGLAYPNSTVTLLKDGQVVATTIAGADASFQINVPGLSVGDYIFSLYAQDNKGVQSGLLTFPITISSGATTKVTGILIPPTISVDKSEVKQGDDIGIYGQSVPGSKITIVINSQKEFFAQTTADKNGNYLYNFTTTPLSLGHNSVKSKFTFNADVSPFGRSVDFDVGTENILKKPTKCNIKVDLNHDCRVDLVDVSILIYWFDKSTIPSKTDFDGDGKVNLTDLSIMAYFWTG